MKVEVHREKEGQIEKGSVYLDFEYENVTTEDIPFKYLQKLQGMGFKPIRVPVRQTGLSSEGTLLRCHGNVYRMVEKYGGMRLEGHEILIPKDDEEGIYGMSHSVWLTPENKLTCISKSNYEKDKRLLSDERTRERGYMLFIPRVLDMFCKETTTFRYHDFTICKNLFCLLDDDGELLEHKGDTQGLKIKSSKHFGTKNDWNTSRELMKQIRVMKLDNMLKSTYFLNPKNSMLIKMKEFLSINTLNMLIKMNEFLSTNTMRNLHKIFKLR